MGPMGRGTVRFRCLVFVCFFSEPFHSFHLIGFFCEQECIYLPVLAIGTLLIIEGLRVLCQEPVF